MSFPTISNLYLFDLNTDDIFGVNDLTFNNADNDGTDYVKGIFDHAVNLNGTDKHLTAASNSVYDVTTEDFWIFGMFYRTSDSGGEEWLAAKKTSGAGATAGYRVVVFSDDSVGAEISDGSTQVQLNAGAISLNTWYAWAASFDRDGNGVFYLYNLSTNTLVTDTESISTVSGSITNSETFNVGSRNGAGDFFPGREDMLIPPHTGSTLSQAQFLALVETGRIQISKRDEDDNAVTMFEARNFSTLTNRGQMPSDAVGDIVGEDEDAILIKALGPQLNISFEFTLGKEESTVVYDDTNTVTTATGQLQYLYDTLRSSGTEQITDEYTLTVYFGNDKSLIRTGMITGIDIIQTGDEPLTFKGTITFLVGTVS